MMNKLKRLHTSSAALALMTTTAVFLGACSSDGTAPEGTGGSDSSAGGSDSSAGGSDSSAGGSDSSTGGSDPTGTPVFGSFTINLQVEFEATGSDAYTSFLGNVRTNTLNSDIAWSQQAQEGDCTIFKATFPFCDPKCASGSSCIEGDICREDPTPLSAGTITIDGVDAGNGKMSFSAEPVGRKKAYQAPSNATLAYPPAAEGAPITFSAVGEDSGPFTVESSGIALLEVPEGQLPLMSGSALDLTWTAAGSAAQSRIQVLVDISHHGGAKGKIVCDTADSGALSVPAALVTSLIDYGVAGFPTVKLSRVAVGNSAPPNEVSFTVAQHIFRDLTIDGLTSCNNDDECAAGETCNTSHACE